MSTTNTVEKWVWIWVCIVAVISLFIIVYVNYKPEKYGTMPQRIYTFGDNNKDLDFLVARLYTNNETIKMPLEKILSSLTPESAGVRIGVFSLDNNISQRHAIESTESYDKILIPYIEKHLPKGLKLAKNADDGTVITQPAVMESSDYPLGQWVFIQKQDNVA